MEDKDETLTAHLEALRSMLVKSLLSLAIGIIPLFLATPYCISWLIKVMIGEHNIALNYFSPMEVFILQIKTAVVLDLLVCSPYIAKQIWNFVLPALHDDERRFIKAVRLSHNFHIVFTFKRCECVLSIFFNILDRPLGLFSKFLRQIVFVFLVKLIPEISIYYRP